MQWIQLTAGTYGWVASVTQLSTSPPHSIAPGYRCHWPVTFSHSLSSPHFFVLSTTEWYILGLAVCTPEGNSSDTYVLKWYCLLPPLFFMQLAEEVGIPECDIWTYFRETQLQTIEAYQSPADDTASLATASSSNPNNRILSTFIDKCVDFFKSQPRHLVSTTYNSILNNLHSSVLHLSLTKHPYSSISTSL